MTELRTETARRLQGEALTAERTRNEAREALRRPDGTNRYGDDEHVERHGAIAEAFREDLARVADEAEREAADAETELVALEHGDPTDLLTAEELGRAGAKRVFVNEDVEALPAAELAGRLRAVLAGGDRASAFCYLRAAEGRLRGMVAMPEGVDEALQDLREYLQGDAKRGRISHARTRVAEAREVSGLVWALRRGGRNAGDVHALQGYGDVAERVAASG